MEKDLGHDPFPRGTAIDVWRNSLKSLSGLHQGRQAFAATVSSPFPQINLHTAQAKDMCQGVCAGGEKALKEAWVDPCPGQQSWGDGQVHLKPL